MKKYPKFSTETLLCDENLRYSILYESVMYEFPHWTVLGQTLMLLDIKFSTTLLFTEHHNLSI